MVHTQKHSAKREAILACIRGTDSHPSAEWVYQQLKPRIPDLSLATVYRNLTLFRSQGLIASVGTVRGLERFDGNPAPHVHFVCEGCGSVIDLPGITLPGFLWTEAESSASCSVRAANLSFSGFCAQCKKEN